MVGMLKSLEKYVEGKELRVNVEKTKVMRCRKEGGRQRIVKWNWKGEKNRRSENV